MAVVREKGVAMEAAVMAMVAGAAPTVVAGNAYVACEGGEGGGNAANADDGNAKSSNHTID